VSPSRLSRALVVAASAAFGSLVATVAALAQPGSPPASAAPPPAGTEATTVAAQHPPHALFLGWETEPAMDYGGRMVASANLLLANVFAGIGDVGLRHPGLAPAWEFPGGATLLLVEHEVMGHGGRAREFHLGPSYGFGFFSGATSTDEPPADHEELSLISVGGVEADGVLAHRLLLDALDPQGIEGAQLPLAMMAKLDLTVYVRSVPSPSSDDFVSEYHHGNDMAIYLVGRQAERLGASAESVWDGSYQPVLVDPLLNANRSDARDAALWNLLDPSLVSGMVAYFRQHVLGGAPRVQPYALRLRTARVTLGTRAALGPQEISRFLDVIAAFDWGTVDVYARELDSSVDTAWGYGAAVHALDLGTSQLSIGADGWQEPTPASGVLLADDSGWNAQAELEIAPAGHRWRAAIKLGDKSTGYFPGTPRDSGVYVGAGVTAAW
jgi:hypothetical protein